MASRKPLVIASSQVQQIQPGDSLGARDSVNGATVSPTSTNVAFVVIPEMTLTVTTIGGQLLVLFDCGFRVLGLDNFNYAVFLDGVEAVGSRRQVANTFSLTLGILSIDNQQPAGVHALLSPSAGAHTIDVRWAQIAGAARANGTQRKLTAIELF